METHDSERELLRLAALAQGVATAADLADYYRTSVRETRPRIAELVEQGDLAEVAVEGWREIAYLHKDAKVKRIEARALLRHLTQSFGFDPGLRDFLNSITASRFLFPKPNGNGDITCCPSYAEIAWLRESILRRIDPPAGCSFERHTWRPTSISKMWLQPSRLSCTCSHVG